MTSQVPVCVLASSCGGWKNSLFVHARVHGPEGFASRTRARAITARWPLHTESQIDLGFPTTR